MTTVLLLTQEAMTLYSKAGVAVYAPPLLCARCADGRPITPDTAATDATSLESSNTIAADADTAGPANDPVVAPATVGSNIDVDASDSVRREPILPAAALHHVSITGQVC